MLTMKIVQKDPDTRMVDGTQRTGFIVRAKLAPNSGNRSTAYIAAVAFFVDETDPIASLPDNSTFDLPL